MVCLPCSGRESLGFFFLISKQIFELNTFQLGKLASNKVLFHANLQEKKEPKVKNISGYDMFIHHKHQGYHNSNTFVDTFSLITKKTTHFFLFSQVFKALHRILKHKLLNYVSSLRNLMLWNSFEVGRLFYFSGFWVFFLTLVLRKELQFICHYCSLL